MVSVISVVCLGLFMMSDFQQWMAGTTASWFAAPFAPQSSNNSTVYGGSPVMEGTVCADVGRTLGGGVVQGDSDNRRLPVGAGCGR